MFPFFPVPYPTFAIFSELSGLVEELRLSFPGIFQRFHSPNHHPSSSSFSWPSAYFSSPGSDHFCLRKRDKWLAKFPGLPSSQGMTWVQGFHVWIPCASNYRIWADFHQGRIRGYETPFMLMKLPGSVLCIPFFSVHFAGTLRGNVIGSWFNTEEAGIKKKPSSQWQSCCFRHTEFWFQSCYKSILHASNSLWEISGIMTDAFIKSWRLRGGCGSSPMALTRYGFAPQGTCDNVRRHVSKFHCSCSGVNLQCWVNFC